MSIVILVNYTSVTVGNMRFVTRGVGEGLRPLTDQCAIRNYQEYSFTLKKHYSNTLSANIVNNYVWFCL